MAALTRLAALLALTVGPAAPPASVARWRPIVEEASIRFGVPSAWIERVLHAESGGRTMLAGAPIRSKVGAIGLMQLMPETWSDMRAVLGLGPDPDDPHDNILAGSFYLRQMYDRFGYPGLFAAYNAGPSRYAAHLATGVPLPPETRAYLAETAGPPSGNGRSATLFAIAPSAEMTKTDAPEPPVTLFVPLNEPSAERQ